VNFSNVTLRFNIVVMPYMMVFIIQRCP